MKKCCFIVAFAILLSVIAPSIPAYAASEPINVMLGADCIRTVNVDTNKYSASSYGGVSDPSKMTDELYGVGPTNKDEGFNTRTIDKWRYYDADGNEDIYGDYLWSVTFDLNGTFYIERLALMTMDLTPFIGNTSPVQWLQMGFDILVSESGEPGSWVVAHRAADLHTETSPGEYTYFAPTDDFPMGYYQYTATFEPVRARYIQFGSTDYTSYKMEQNHWINISELEIYSVGDTPAVPSVPTEEGNVMRHATFVRGHNFREDYYSASQYGGVCSPEKVTDGRYGVGPTQVDDGFNSQIIEHDYFDLEGNKDDSGGYLWYMIFRLDNEYTVDRFSLIIDDLTTCGIGDTDPVQWLQKGFEILVSESGEPGSWKVVYANWSAHTETDKGDYQYFAPTEERPLGYYKLDASFAPEKARYVCFGSTSLTSRQSSYGHWINITEWQVYTPAPPLPTEPGNVMRNATYLDSVNMRNKFSPSLYGGVSSPEKVMDGRYGMGPVHTDDGLNTKIAERDKYYTADGHEDDNGIYLWMMTFQLDKEYTLSHFSLMIDDLTTCGIGRSRAVQWLQRSFDILVSESGQDGSWQVAYSAGGLHSETSRGHYQYVSPTAERPLGYFVISGNLEPVKARYIRFASAGYTSTLLDENDWINITELQIFDNSVQPDYPDIPETPTEPLPLPNGQNVMRTAQRRREINISLTDFGTDANGVKSDTSRMIDGIWAKGPRQKDEGLSTRILSLWTHYDANGSMSQTGQYMWSVSFKLDQEYSINGLRLITMDMSEEIGDTDTIQWLQRDFDILISDTGADGSWQVVYSARALHSDENPGAYRYQEATDDKLAYYEFIDEFDATSGAQYIQFASLSHTSDTMESAHWINIGELEIYGTATPATLVDSGTCSDTVFWELTEFGKLRIFGTGDMPDWEYGGAPWKSHVNSVNFIVVESGITAIGNHAFGGCTQAMSVSLPDGITKIGDSAFFHCVTLPSLVIPDTVSELGKRAFESCSGLKELVIPGSISVLSESAFSNDYGLKTVTIGEGVSHIESFAFGGCTGLSEIHFPKSVVQIGEQAFNNCTGLTAVTVDGENPFFTADETGALLTKDKTTLLLVPASIAMEEYTIPASVTHIGPYAFGYSRLKAVTVPAGVVQIGTRAFMAANPRTFTVLSDTLDLSSSSIPITTTIYGFAGSAAEAYAARFRNPFVVISRGGVDGQIRIYHPRTAVHVRLLQGETEVYTATITPTAGSDTVSFSFRDVSAGTYDMQIDGDGLLPYTIRGIVVADAVVDLTAHENEAISTITPAAGDIDGNGFIDLADVVLLTSESTYGLSYEEARTKAADVNGDGIFDLQDLAIVTSEIGYGRSAVLVDFH